MKPTKKKIIDYIPDDDKDVSTIMAKVPTSIVQESRKHMDAGNITWNELITACLENFCDQMKSEKKNCTQ